MFYSKMEKRRQLKFFLVIPIFILLILSFRHEIGRAAEGEDEPVRQAQVLVSYTRYKWWLIRWVDNLILCTVYANQDGLPTDADIYDSCGETIYETWKNTAPCDRDAKNCEGVYLHLISQEPAERTVTIEYPPPVVEVNLVNCPRFSADNLCDRLPGLQIAGKEPIPGEEITAVRGFYNGKPFYCPGSACEVPLAPTPIQGITIDFFVESSFGDVSETYKAIVRVVDSGTSSDPNRRGWYVDILSDEWVGNPVPTCAQIWDAFPPIGEPPNWLATPAIPELLATENPYYYLAGRLISQGLADASACPSLGLQVNGYANECGLEAAQLQVFQWQNRFDAQILQVANEVQIPAQILKNLFSQESQFWPGAFKDPKEFGLGQLTDNGAETILMWNTRYFHQFCPTILDAETCRRGYVYLDEAHQELVRGALAKGVQSDCQDCAVGVDLENVERSINLFANTLVANCAQVSRIVFNSTERSPGQVSDYTSLWQFTAANYHVGPGCMSYAIYSAWTRRVPLDWEHVQDYLTPACQSALGYVDNLTK